MTHAETGDLIGLCPTDKIDFHGIHVGVISVEDDGTYVLHNAKHEGIAQMQKIEDVLKHPKHQKISWIKRPIVEDPTIQDTGALQQLGFTIPVDD